MDHIFWLLPDSLLGAGPVEDSAREQAVANVPTAAPALISVSGGA